MKDGWRKALHFALLHNDFINNSFKLCFINEGPYTVNKICVYKKKNNNISINNFINIYPNSYIFIDIIDNTYDKLEYKMYIYVDERNDCLYNLNLDILPKDFNSILPVVKIKGKIL